MHGQLLGDDFFALSVELLLSLLYRLSIVGEPKREEKFRGEKRQLTQI